MLSMDRTDALVIMSEVLGVGKGTVRLEDFAKADLIISIGQNPGTNHPRMLSTLREAKLAGATLIAINPLREAGLLAFSHPQKPQDLAGGVRVQRLANRSQPRREQAPHHHALRHGTDRGRRRGRIATAAE